MKRMILATSFVVGLMTSASLLAMAPATPASTLVHLPLAGETVGQVPLLLAAGDAWEARHERLHQPLSRKLPEAPARQDVRDTNPWWR